MKFSSEPAVRVFIWVPIDFVAPEPFEITLNAAATTDETKVAIYNDGPKFRRPDGL